ncbi:MAG TPA: GNAT family N-acetyltransferase [Casimicrobiaceae bacterium]
MSGFTVRVADWRSDHAALAGIRRAVFIVEQQVPENLEWDDIDAQCLHALAHDAHGTPIGCGRLLPDGYIGRMAVVAPWRGRGVGGALLTRLMEIARARGDARVLLNAQVQAMPFYARHGFAPQGPPFDEAGIPHQTMALALR